MNLHGIVAPYIGVVNPLIPVSVQVSAGQTTDPENGFAQTPTYATPGALTGAIAGNVLTVSAVSTGKIQSGQTIAGLGLLPNTEIVEQLSGADGGIGTYRLSRTYDAPVSSVAIASALLLMAQVQPISWRDLQQMDGLNLGGTRRKIYLYGSVEAVKRVSRQGGDLITIAGGVNDGVWLVAQVLEQFPDWVSAAITLQNDGNTG